MCIRMYIKLPLKAVKAPTITSWFQRAMWIGCETTQKHNQSPHSRISSSAMTLVLATAEDAGPPGNSGSWLTRVWLLFCPCLTLQVSLLSGAPGRHALCGCSPHAPTPAGLEPPSSGHPHLLGCLRQSPQSVGTDNEVSLWKWGQTG